MKIKAEIFKTKHGMNIIIDDAEFDTLFADDKEWQKTVATCEPHDSPALEITTYYLKRNLTRGKLIESLKDNDVEDK